MKNSTTLIIIFLFLAIPNLNAMKKKDGLRSKNPQPTNYQTSYDDNPGSCCLCGLMACTCVSGTASALSIINSLPLATTATWAYCFLTGIYLLSEIHEAYSENKKSK